MRAELTAENKPAYTMEEELVFTVEVRVQCAYKTHEDKGGVQIIILPRVLSVKHIRFLMIYNEKVGAWVVRTQCLEELLPPDRMQGYEPVVVQLDPKWCVHLVRRPPKPG